MATVTVVTSERTLEIEATSIVSGGINDEGHLVLTRHDGTPIDMGAVSGMQMDSGSGYSKVDTFAYIGTADPGAVPDGSIWYDTNNVAGPLASDTQKGLVELATNAETIAGVDNIRAVTPSSVKAALDAVAAANPGYKIQFVSGIAENATPASWPYGISMQSVSGSAWSPSASGTVVTESISSDRTTQTFYMAAGGSGYPSTWTRTYHTTLNGGGWTAWVRFDTVATLLPANFTGTTVPSAYPIGTSRLIFTTTNASTWSFSGWAGEVVTFRNGTDFTKQTFIRLSGGSGSYTEMWIRTASDSAGWGAWRKVNFQDLQPVTAYGTVVVPGGSGTTMSTSVTFPAGRFPTAPNVVATALTTVPGTQVLGVGVSNITATGCDIFVNRNNSTNTNVAWQAML